MPKIIWKSGELCVFELTLFLFCFFIFFETVLLQEKQSRITWLSHGSVYIYLGRKEEEQDREEGQGREGEGQRGGAIKR